MFIQKIKFITSMAIVGSVGLFVRVLPLASSQIAMVRGFIGCLFVLICCLLSRKTFSLQRIRSDLWTLIFSGISLGINWILLFEAYQYTSIANATICYYFAPAIVILLSPLVLKEKLSLLKVGCVSTALIGIVLIAGLGSSGHNNLLGIFYGLGAALFYAAVMLLNKFLHKVTSMERTVIQLGISTLALLPYVLLTTSLNSEAFTLSSLEILLIVGIVHTGIVYLLYFSSMEHLPSQSIALLSYIDPVVAILLSALLLHEPMSLTQILGGILIIGSALVSENFAKTS